MLFLSDIMFMTKLFYSYLHKVTGKVLASLQSILKFNVRAIFCKRIYIYKVILVNDDNDDNWDLNFHC